MGLLIPKIDDMTQRRAKIALANLKYCPELARSSYDDHRGSVTSERSIKSL
jgi:hypothetical protein